MCGLVAYFNFDASRRVDESLLRRMTNVMIHRGPDDSGFWINRNVGLGFRRLSIIDLSPAGHQPMSNEDGSVWIVFNGEIYNFQDLYRELEGHGHRFRSRSDTEVILHGYEQWGAQGCLEALRGMFALAIWDQRKEQLFVARDRLGIKPVYFWRDSSSLIVASELKAILENPQVPRRVDRQALLQHFGCRFSLPPRTIFETIAKLSAGHFLLATSREFKIEEYWRPPACGDGTRAGLGRKEFADELHQRIHETVRRHLISDVPLGAFLSGGVDSSALVGVMTESMDQPVKTYTAGFAHGWHDESAQAQTIATFHHTEHHQIRCEPASIELLQKIIWHLEEPLINTSVIPLYLVAQLASRDVKVVLTGDGSDEVNGGYQKYALIERLVRLRRWRQFIPGVSPASNWIIDQLPASPLTARIKRLNRITQCTGAGYLALSSNLFDSSQNSLFNAEFWRNSGNTADELESLLLENYHHVKDVRQQFFIYDIRGWLENELLIRADKMTMAHSLEARVPYLDHELVEFCLNIPPELKVNHGGTKRVLRQAMQKYLPEEIACREQHGFVVPLADWFREGLRDFVQDLTHDTKARSRGVFNFDFIDKGVTAHIKGTADFSSAIFGVIIVELWFRTFIDQKS